MAGRSSTVERSCRSSATPSAARHCKSRSLPGGPVNQSGSQTRRPRYRCDTELEWERHPAQRSRLHAPGLRRARLLVRSPPRSRILRRPPSAVRDGIYWRLAVQRQRMAQHRTDTVGRGDPLVGADQ